MNLEKLPHIKIDKLEHADEIEICARMMTNSEPWITLRRDYQASVETLSVPSKEIYLALHDGQIAGFVILNLQGAFIGYIQTVCVSPVWRGKGIGSQLVDFAEGMIFSQAPNVFICVSSFNKGAQRLYQRFGYEVIGELKDYIVSGHSEVLMGKTIAPLSEYTKG